MVTVRLHGVFGGFAGTRVAKVEGSTVAEALAALVVACPALRERLRDEHGRLRPHINVFANEEEMRHLEGEGTALRDGDVLRIIPAVSGGR